MKKSAKKFYSCSEIRKKILEEGKLPAITGKGGYTSAILGGGRKNKIILKWESKNFITNRTRMNNFKGGVLYGKENLRLNRRRNQKTVG